MREQDKNKDGLYISRSLELLIWLVIVLLVVSISMIIYIHNEKYDNNDYQIFMPDVDGLIIGSPVRMMGIEVGHVVKIKPVHGEVYIKFIITEPNIIVPHGTIATVEFSGMAGSKSLELYLPDENTYVDKNVPIISVHPPKRLHDAVSLLDDMFDKIGSMITAASIFGNNLKKNVEFPKGGSPEDVRNFVKYADDMVEKSNDISENCGRKLYDGRYSKNKELENNF